MGESAYFCLQTNKNMKKTILSICLFGLLAVGVQAQRTPRGELAPTPPMGWMTWNMFRGNISEQLIRETADAMVANGLDTMGYKYIFIDDLWQGGRDARNNIIPDPVKFPSAQARHLLRCRAAHLRGRDRQSALRGAGCAHLRLMGHRLSQV